MTDRDLSTLLLDHVRATEPPLGLTPGEVILTGRRVLRRRRIRRGVASVALIGAAAVAATALVLPDDTADRREGIDPASAAALADYDAGAMPGVLHRAIGPIVGGSISPDLSLDRAFAAYDDQGEKLPLKYWDKASSMELTYGGEGPHRVRLSLMHARSEAEGDREEGCRADLESGYAFSCDVTTVGGEVVSTQVTAVRPMEDGTPGWAAVTRGELESGRPTATSPSQEPIDPDQIYFMRTVESVHSDTFLTLAQEIVKAPNATQAGAAWRISVADLTRVVTNPTLVIPEPPLGRGGCPWTWKADVTCSKN